ncbi:hypothetical protein CANCADRAFT_32291 [Tortispora caseinolytica NRRL Y-17796]|uniref:Uncharacterized protein n=1 Tax=Tortispora caseinolytica NRRL Y-17796 TaxID=767744 RepID=A0A1E4TAN1_9ASCO|nr:hypothetical protein CANCADRAFT_32291 [Tortispora caseinolytica NRRL Y-17796]
MVEGSACVKDSGASTGEGFVEETTVRASFERAIDLLSWRRDAERFDMKEDFLGKGSDFLEKYEGGDIER